MTNPRKRAYQRWKLIKQRCYTPTNRSYRWYGGRGIGLCNEWHTFDRFYADVGDPPAPGVTLDRIDNNKGYQPDNVRWATPKEQAANRRPTSVRSGGRPKGSKDKNPRSSGKTEIYDGDIRLSMQEAAGWLGVTYESIKWTLRKLRNNGKTRVDISELTP